MKQQLINKCSAQQSSAVLEGSQRRNTKHESAWPFRIWYNFDHKYPLSQRSVILSSEVWMLDSALDTRGCSSQTVRSIQEVYSCSLKPCCIRTSMMH